MQTRGHEIKQVRQQMNRLEDDIFIDFCSEIGVENIRQYEERDLQEQESREQKRMEYENQKQRIQNQLDYERSRDTRGMLQANTFKDTNEYYILDVIS